VTQKPEDLAKKIKDARARQGQDDPASRKVDTGDSTATGKALRAATDLVAALFVGGFLGYWLDRWLHTKPLFMIVMFFAGFAAGFLNIYRAQTGQDFNIGFKNKKKDGDQSP
jgi:ATP synthase protein I